MTTQLQVVRVQMKYKRVKGYVSFNTLEIMSFAIMLFKLLFKMA